MLPKLNYSNFILRSLKSRDLYLNGIIIRKDVDNRYHNIKHTCFHVSRHKYKNPNINIREYNT